MSNQFEERNAMQILATVLMNKSSVGPLISLSTTICYWIGVVTPYVAFLALIAGLGLTIYSWRVKYLESKKLGIEIYDLEHPKKK